MKNDPNSQVQFVLEIGFRCSNLFNGFKLLKIGNRWIFIENVPWRPQRRERCECLNYALPLWHYLSFQKLHLLKLKCQFHSEASNRDLFPLDGAGLKRLFHNGAIITTNQNRRFDDVIKCVELLRQAVRVAAIVKLGLLLFWNKSVHFGNILRK